VEALRDDHANHILGLRLNDWTSLIVFLAATGYLIASRNRPTREHGIHHHTPDPENDPAEPRRV
jgi:hypothetical protein